MFRAFVASLLMVTVFLPRIHIHAASELGCVHADSSSHNHHDCSDHENDRDHDDCSEQESVPGCPCDHQDDENCPGCQPRDYLVVQASGLDVSFALSLDVLVGQVPLPTLSVLRTVYDPHSPPAVPLFVTFCTLVI